MTILTVMQNLDNPVSIEYGRSLAFLYLKNTYPLLTNGSATYELYGNMGVDVPISVDSVFKFW